MSARSIYVASVFLARQHEHSTDDNIQKLLHQILSFYTLITASFYSFMLKIKINASRTSFVGSKPYRCEFQRRG